MVVAASLTDQITERLNQYDTLDMAVALDELTIPMQDIYHKVVLTRDTNA